MATLLRRIKYVRGKLVVLHLYGPLGRDQPSVGLLSYYYQETLLSMESWGLRPKKFQTCVAVPPAPVRVPSHWPLAPSLTLVTFVN